MSEDEARAAVNELKNRKATCVSGNHGEKRKKGRLAAVLLFDKSSGQSVVAVS